MSKKIALGLSGGVDSSVCALLLKQSGYEVVGVYLECFNEVGCRSDQDRRDAFEIAKQLDIPFTSLDLKSAYKEKVLDYFYRSYQSGQTPNPDLLCNREIKFGLFYDFAMQNGFDAVATGHYAKILEFENHHYLAIPQDAHKDQTYFLALLTEQKLAHILFPLADLEKPAVRKLADENNLATAHKKDSTGVCFVGEFSLRDFLNKQFPLRPGKLLNVDGQEIGTHQGAPSYTIGQRHGFNVFNESTNAPALYVIAKDIQNNTVTVGPKELTARHQLKLQNFNLINPHLRSKLTDLPLFIRVRHTGELIPGKINSTAQTLTFEPVRAVQGVGSGQFGVIYAQSADLFSDQNVPECMICLGAGEIG